MPRQSAVGAPKWLAALPVWKGLEQARRAALDAAVRSCFSCLPLYALRVQQEESLAVGLRDALEELVHVELVEDPECSRVFGEVPKASAKRKQFRGAELLDFCALLLGEAERDGVQEVSVAFGLKRVEGSDTEYVVVPEVAKRILEAYCAVGNTAKCLAGLRNKMEDGAASSWVVRETKQLRGDLEAMLVWLRSSLGDELARHSSGYYDCLKRLAVWPWVFPAKAVNGWVAKAVALAEKAVREAVVLQSESITQLSMECAAWCPAYDNVITARKVNLPLAKRTLLTWPSRDSLSKGSVALYSALADASRVAVKFGVEAPAELDAARATFNQCRAALVVMAAVSACAELSGPEQQAQCKALMGKAGFMPQPLQQLVARLARGQATPQAAARAPEEPSASEEQPGPAA